MAAELTPLHNWLKPSPERGVLRSSRLRCEALEDRVTPSIGFGFSGDISLGLAPEATASSLSASTVETAIAIDPTAPGNLVVTTNNFGATNLEVTARSTTAGASWSTVTIGNSVDTLPNTGDRFDGTVATDRFGNIHIVYEHRNGSIVYAYSSNGGQSYTGRVLSIDPSCDKPWLSVGPDAADPSHDAVWVTYSHDDAASNGQIYTRAASISGSGTVGAFTAEVQVSAAGKNVNYAIPAVGPDGRVSITYQGNNGVATAETIYVRSDSNGLVGGVSFGSEVTVTSSNGGSFDYNLATPDRGYFAEPYLAYDRSGGPNTGRVYMVYVDEPVDGSHDNVILVRHSDDGGGTWSAATQASDTAVNTRMFSTVSVDQTTGFLYITWYDARNDRANGGFGDSDTDGIANDEVQYFGTVSTDGGASFLENVQLSNGTSNQARANPDGNDFGDYTGLAAFGGSAFSSWADDASASKFATHVRRFVLQSTGGETVTATADPTDTTYYIRLDASGTFVQFYENNPALAGTPTFTSTLSAMNSIVINGGDGNDSIVIDLGNGNPIPVGGITVHGGGGVNSLSYIHTTGAAYGRATNPRAGIVYTPTGATSGDLRIANGAPLRFDGINGSFNIVGVGDTLTVLAPSAAGLQSDYLEVAAGSGMDTVTVSDQYVAIGDNSLGNLRSVSFGGLATLYVRGGNEYGPVGDTFVVTPSSTMNIVVDGMGPQGQTPGDVLIANSTGSFTVATGTAAQGLPQTRYIHSGDGASFGFLGFETLPFFPQSAAVATDGGVAAEVRAVDPSTGAVRWAAHPFDGFAGTVSIAMGDFNRDGIRDVIVGAGPGAGPRVVILNGIDGSQIASFFAFSPGFAGGVTVASGDVNGDGIADIIVGADSHGFSHVKVFDGRNFAEMLSFYAFRPDFEFGVTVAAGDVNGDGHADIIVGGGYGAPPQFRVFDPVSGAVLQDQMAFSSDYAGGISIAAGDVNGDGYADVIIGSGRDSVPHVRVFSGATGAELASFYVNNAFAPTDIPNVPNESGVSVAAADLNGDGIDEILTGKGLGTFSILRSFRIAHRSLDGSTAFAGVQPVASPTVFAGYYGGITVAG